MPECVTAALFVEESAERLWLACALGEAREYTAERARIAGRLEDLG